MENKAKRFLRLLLAIAMVMAIVPMTFAAATETGNVAKIGDTEYATLKAALEAVADGQTITLLQDVTLGEKLTISGNVTISGAHTITRADTYTGTLFAVNKGATLTLDGGLTIDGGNNWTYVEVDGEKKFLHEAENYDGSRGYGSVDEFVTPEPDVPVATADLITVSGTLILNNVTIQNNWGKDGANVVDVATGAQLIMNEGAKITHNVTDGQGPAVKMNKDSYFTMNGGEISWNAGRHHGGGAVSIHGGYMTMNGGEISHNFSVDGMGVAIFVYDTRSHSDIKQPTFTMNGGEISNNICLPGPSANRNGTVIYARNGIMEMHGGSINNNYGRNFAGIGVGSVTLTITGGSVVNNQNVMGNTNETFHDLIGEVTTKICGGTFTQDVTDWVADGYKLFENENGTWSVADENSVARIGNNFYSSIADAVAAVPSNSTATIVILKDYTETKFRTTNGFAFAVWFGNGKQITIDFAGHTVTFDSSAYSEYNTQSVFYVSTAGASLTLTGNGTIKYQGPEGDGTTKNPFMYMIWAQNGTVTVENGTFIAGTDDKTAYANMLYVNQNGHIYVKGGSFTHDPEGGSIINMLNGSTGMVVVTGGTFNQDILTETQKGEVEIPEDYRLVNNGNGTWSVIGKHFVAQIGEKNFATLADAIAVAKAGDTIKLLVDISHSGIAEIAADANVNLDLNGYVLTADAVRWSGGNIIDSAEETTGGVKVDSDVIELSTNNIHMPVYDKQNGCYRFFEYTLQSKGPEMIQVNKQPAAKFGIYLRFPKLDAYKLIANQDATHYVSLPFVLTINGQSYECTFNPGTIAKWAAAAWTYYKIPENQGEFVLMLAVKGLDELNVETSLTIVPTVGSYVKTQTSKKPIPLYSVPCDPLTVTAADVDKFAQTITTTDLTKKEEESGDDGNTEASTSGGDDPDAQNP